MSWPHYLVATATAFLVCYAIISRSRRPVDYIKLKGKGGIYDGQYTMDRAIEYAVCNPDCDVSVIGKVGQLDFYCVMAAGSAAGELKKQREAIINRDHCRSIDDGWTSP